MRILFMPAPAVGHAFPMVPLAWAFRAAGHDVVFVTGGDGLAVAQAGLPVLDAMPGRTTNDLYGEFVRDYPELFEPVTGEPVAGLDERKPAIVACWDRCADAHVAAAVRVRPDLVVYDPIFGIGPLAAATLRIPSVALGFTICRYSPDLLRELPAGVAFRRHGLDVPPGIPTIDLAPPSVVEGAPSGLPMRCVPYNGSAVLPEWLLDPPQRPRVAVTFGSLEQAHGSGAFGSLAAAAAAIDAEFVVTSGDSAAVRPDLPPNVRLVGWLPLSALLPTCVAAIHHGGSGSSLTCCASGIPQLVLPEGRADAAAEAELLRLRGAAHVAHGDVDEATLGGLLADDKLRAVAGEVAEEMAAMPPPAHLVPRLAALAGG